MATVLSRKAVLLQGACMAFLAPKLALDAKIELTPAFAGVSAKNYAEKKSGIATAIKTATKGKLAKDASIDGLEKLLDALEGAEVEEGVDADPNSGLPMTKEEMEKKAKDEEPMAKARKFLEGKLSAEDLKAFDDMMDDDDSAMDETEEEKKAREEREKAAKDKAAKDGEPEKVTKAAMDEAIKVAAKQATDNAIKTQREIRDAERIVRPYVGDIVIACDSADAVFKTALTALNVKIDGVHPSAYRTILEMQPKPGDKAKTRAAEHAMDSASATGFASRYPEAARIGNQG